jgi:ribosomal protein S8
VDYANLLFNLIFYHLSDFVSRVHIASCKRITTVNILYNKMNFRTIYLLYIEGFVEGFRVFNDIILIFLRYSYLNMFMLLKIIKILSTPGKR